jgi:hypothetical protein
VLAIVVRTTTEVPKYVKVVMLLAVLELLLHVKNHANHAGPQQPLVLKRTTQLQSLLIVFARKANIIQLQLRILLQRHVRTALQVIRRQLLE